MPAQRRSSAQSSASTSASAAAFSSTPAGDLEAKVAPVAAHADAKRIAPTPADTETLSSVHRQLVESLAAATRAPHTHAAPVSSAPSTIAVQAPSVWVSTWVDYTSKYGMGYLLSNGSIGVYFNDSTKIVLASDDVHFEYMVRAPTTVGSDGVARRVDPPRQAHTLSDYPAELQKKVTLLKHFRGFLRTQYDSKHRATATAEETACMRRGSPSHDIPLVKKWVRTRHAVLFRLSNRTVQINFFDHTSITLSAERPLMTYVNKDGSRTHHKLSSVMAEDRPDITKRLKYTRDILSQLIHGSR